MFCWAKTLDLVALILLVFILLKKVLSVSSYGHFTAAKEFWSQCHIFRFGNEQFEICWGNQRGRLGGITWGKRHSGAFRNSVRIL